MRRIILTAVLAMPLLMGTAGAADHESIGPVMMNHRMEDLDGNPVKLSDLQGEVLVVNFWASWCAPCRRELPILDRWNATWREAGARVVAISIDSKEKNAREFVDRAGLDLTVWLDGPSGLAPALDLPAVPTSFVIDRDGNVVLRIVGSSDEDLDRMARKVQSLLKDRTGRPQA